MVKRNDDQADPGKDITAEAPRSVKSGRTIDDVMKEAAAAAGEAGRGAVRARRSSGGARGSTPSFAPAKFFPPMLAQAVQAPNSGADAALPGGRAEWMFEPKLDGFRCLASRDGNKIQLQSKSGRPMTRYFPELVAALAAGLPDRLVPLRV